MSFSVGTKVEAQYAGMSDWYKGVIERLNANGTYFVKYDDGDTEDNVPPQLIRAIGDTSAAAAHSDAATQFFEGDAIQCCTAGTDTWSDAVVIRQNSNGTYKVEMDDGTIARFVQPSMIRSASPGGSGGGPRGRMSPLGGSGVFDSGYTGRRSPLSMEFEQGQEVDARSSPGGPWMPGAVFKVNAESGSYDIVFDNGDFRPRIEAENVRASSNPTSGGVRSDDSDMYQHQTPSPQNHRRQHHRRSGSEDVLVGNSSAVGGGPYVEGSIVEALFDQGQTWYRGKIARVHTDGTYTVLYDDGDVEEHVSPDLIRCVGGVSYPLNSTSISGGEVRTPRGGGQLRVTFQKGDRVEARFEGGNAWYLGHIIKAHRDGTYNIEYDDGDRENRVEPALIRFCEASPHGPGAGQIMSPRTPFGDPSPPPMRPLSKGDRVEARFEQGDMWYKGSISKAHSDGTYSIKYDDGDKETHVDPTFIRPLVPTSATATSPTGMGGPNNRAGSPELLDSFVVGQPVEARFERGDVWYTGIVSKVRSNGSCDIKYTDGDREKKVPVEFIRPLEQQQPPHMQQAPSTPIAGGIRVPTGGAASAAAAVMGFASPTAGQASPRVSLTYRKGDRVEARFEGGNMWYTGRVSKAHRDGTFSIEYDDGDKESHVEPVLIRHLDTNEHHALHPSTEDPVGPRVAEPALHGEARGAATLQKGDRIEARFEQGDMWYKGSISKAHSDGTYSIKYDDGDKESHVSPQFIRLFGTSIALGDVEAPHQLHDDGSSTAVNVFEVGQAVEALFDRGDMWYTGVIARVRSQNCYDIHYSDGDHEKQVPVEFIRAVHPPAGHGMQGNEAPHNENQQADAGTPSLAAVANRDNQDENELHEGDMVEALFGGGTAWYGGRIAAVRPDGRSFRIEYDDGDVEDAVDRTSIRLIKRGPGVSSSKVESHERRAEPQLESENRSRQTVKTSRTNSRSSSSSSGEQSQVQLHIGDIVEARFGGGDVWYRGTISAVDRAKSAHTIEYEDGDTEDGVPIELIRLLEAAPVSTENHVLAKEIPQKLNSQSADNAGVSSAMDLEQQLKPSQEAEDESNAGVDNSDDGASESSEQTVEVKASTISGAVVLESGGSGRNMSEVSAATEKLETPLAGSTAGASGQNVSTSKGKETEPNEADPSAQIQSTVRPDSRGLSRGHSRSASRTDHGEPLAVQGTQPYQRRRSASQGGHTRGAAPMQNIDPMVAQLHAKIEKLQQSLDRSPSLAQHSQSSTDTRNEVAPFQGLSVVAQTTLADRISQIVTQKLTETLSPQNAFAASTLDATASGSATSGHEEGANSGVLSQLQQTLRLFKTEIIDEIEEKLHIEQSVDELKALMRKQRRERAENSDGRGGSRARTERSRRGRAEDNNKRGVNTASSKTVSAAPTTHDLFDPDQALHSTTLLAGEATPKFVGDENRREQLASRNFARKLAQLAEMQDRRAVADSDGSSDEANQGAQRGHRRKVQPTRPAWGARRPCKSDTLRQQAKSDLRHGSPRVQQSIHRTQQWQQRRQREVAQSQRSIRAFRKRRAKRAEYRQHVRVEILAFMSKFAGPACLSNYGRLVELLGSLVDPIPSSHFRLEQATLSQLVLVKRELRRVGLLQLLRAEEAALLKGLIKSMRERHATLRKRLASAAQQKAVGMLSDALAQCERYHVDFEDELEDAVVLCANLSADVASGEGVEDRGITKYLYEHTASSQPIGNSTPRRLPQPSVEDGRDGSADFEQNSSTPRWGISNEDERLDPLEFDYVAAAELKRVAVPPQPVHEVVRAALVLLGCSARDTLDWKQCRKFLTRNGRYGLQQLISGLNISELTVSQVHKAHALAFGSSKVRGSPRRQRERHNQSSTLREEDDEDVEESVRHERQQNQGWDRPLSSPRRRLADPLSPQHGHAVGIRQHRQHEVASFLNEVPIEVQDRRLREVKHISRSAAALLRWVFEVVRWYERIQEQKQKMIDEASP